MRKLLFILLAGILSQASTAQTFQNVNTYPVVDTTNTCVPIVVSGLPTVMDGSFGLVSVCFNIVHTYTGDLIIILKSPSGDSVTLASGLGGGGHDYANTCVSESASNGFIINAAAPFTGNFIPMNSINAFNNGSNPNGIWTLCVEDAAYSDTGHINLASITFGINPPSDPGPPPILCPTCTCPGGAAECDLLPDMTASGLIISQTISEVPGGVNFGNATPNIGWGPIEIHAADTCFCGTTIVPCSTVTCPGGEVLKHRVMQRIYHKRAGNDTLTTYDRPAGTMSFHPTHGHIHVDNWGNFTLRKQTSNPDATTWPIIGTGSKQSFCLINLGNCTANPGYCVRINGDTLTTDSIPNYPFGVVSGCGLDQGIYTGMLDIYSAGLNQGIDLSDICNGNYFIVSVTDIENNFLETDETNNWTAVPVTLTGQANPSTIQTCSYLYTVSGDTVTFINTSLDSGPFFWDFGDGTTSSDDNPVHIYAANGTYSVTLEVLHQCLPAYTDHLNINTGIPNHIPVLGNADVMPNPFTDNLIVQYILTQPSFVNVSLTDLSGRVLLLKQSDSYETGFHAMELSTQNRNLPAGIYFVKIQTNTGYSLNRKVVKMD